MKIIILGAGKVGKTLTKYMANEDHDIIVIDQNADKIDDVVNQYDVDVYKRQGHLYMKIF